MENYSQISLTCIVCKIAEAVVRTRVVEFWSDVNLFNPDQFAYIRGKSTSAKLLTCYNDWAKARNRSQQTDIQPRSQGSLLPVPTERARERPWLGLVTWSQNKINSEGGVPCLSIFLSGSFSPFTPGFTQ